MTVPRTRVALLVYFSLCRHFVDAARAVLDGASGPEEGSLHEIAGVGVAGATVSSTPAQGGIPLHQAKILWRDIKEKMVKKSKKSKCRVPDGRSHGDACRWFTCKYEFHKTKFEETKINLEVTHREIMGDYSEDWLLSINAIRNKYYKVVKYMLLQHDRGCDPQQETVDDLRVWTKTMFPERYDCIFEIVDAYLANHENCDERFTRTFKHAMNTIDPKCKNKNFYHDDMQSPKPAVLQKKLKPGKGETIIGAAGILVGGAAPFVAAKLLDVTLSTGTTAASVSAGTLAFGWSVFVVSLAVGAGILAASIAFLVCKYLPKKKRSGVRLGAAGDGDSVSPLDEPKSGAVSHLDGRDVILFSDAK